MVYSFVRNALFLLEPETAHKFTLISLKWLQQSGILSLFKRSLSAPRQVMGIIFPNPVGLAAGLDKNAEFIEPLAALGFGFIEVGTVLPLSQSGQPLPRLFRLPQAQALINRMGFPSKGVDYVVAQINKISDRGVLGINIGKNLTTPLAQAIDDYLICLRKVYSLASYITINISSPNTPGLRELQYGDYLEQLLATLKQEQTQLAKLHNKYVPLAIKISPDLSADEVKQIALSLIAHNIDAVIATNTSISRQHVEHLANANEQGGLSGKPLFEKSLTVVQQLAKSLQDKLPIIACGGISSEKDALTMLNAGASLLQIYTGFIYQGPQLIKEIVKNLPA